MSLEQVILEKIRLLPVEKQQEVLDFAEFLHSKMGEKRSPRTIKDLCADLKIDITEEDIAQARQEMWGNFPREDI